MILSSNQSSSHPSPNGWALLPFLVFIGLNLGTGLVLQLRGVEMAFYQLPSPVAILAGIVVAFLLFSGTMEEKFSLFAKGCGDENILTMCVIYLLAGAFSAVAGACGGVDSTVYLCLRLVPMQYITAGMFLLSAFLSIATGTSMGTISTIGPIAIATAAAAQVDLPLMVATVVGGAMFGDNLSMISDTTIAATRTQDVAMKDKFHVNFLIALPTAIITFVLLLLFGRPDTIVPLETGSFSIIKVVPYVVVLGLAAGGVNVFVTLTCGIALSGCIGLATGSFSLLSFATNIYSGFTNMTEIFLLSLLTGGLAKMVTVNGGLAFLLKKIQTAVRGQKSARLGIMAIAALGDIAVANNTIAILITGPIAKGICRQYQVDPRCSASLLDISSCIVQGILPYGAQVLLACSLTAGVSPVSPITLIPLMWYPLLLAFFALLSLWVPFADGLLRRQPWDHHLWIVRKEK